MGEVLSIPPNPQLSPEFDKARAWSQILAFLFSVGYWATLAFLVVISAVSVWPESVGVAKNFIQGITPEPITVPIWGRVGGLGIVVVVFVPIVAVFHSAQRVFRHFARGEVFSASTIERIRTTALWLIVAGIIPPRPVLLIVGIAAYVTAYVMAEARRIADDNASII